MAKRFSTLFLALLSFSLFGQRINKENIEFSYAQAPLVRTLGNQPFQSEVIVDYKAEVDRQEAEAEAEYQAALAEYPAVEAAAKAVYDQIYAEYEKALADWNSKSLAGKFIEKQLLENQKPLPPAAYYPPAKPVKRSVYHQYVFDGELINQSYASIAGRNRGEGGIRVEMHLFGYDRQDPTVETKETSVYDTKTKATRKEIKSQYVVLQKHPISVTVTSADGQVLFTGTVAGTEEYSKYESGFVNGSPSMPSRESMEKSMGEASLKLVKNWLDNQYGTMTIGRTSIIRVPENKKVDYGDFKEAFYLAQEGYELLGTDESRGQAKLKEAIALWNDALKEVDMDDKKARVNKKVTPDLYLNLIEACIFAHEFTMAADLISATRRLDFNKRDMDDIGVLKVLLEDLQLRY